MANSPSGESMITRVVRLLAVFPAHTRSLSVREVAAEAALPVSTTHRLLGELESEDLVARDADGLWQRGNRLWEIASRGSHPETLREAALPAMEDVVAGLDVHISLGILDRNEVLYLERLTPNDFTVNITAIAGRLPAHATSAGLVLTAHGPKQSQELMLRRNLTRYTETTTTNSAELHALLSQARRDGFITSPGAIIPESTGISVPVFGTGKYAIASLTVIVPVGEERLKVIVPQLKLAARAIQRRLGISPDALPGFRRETRPGPTDI